MNYLFCRCYLGITASFVSLYYMRQDQFQKLLEKFSQGLCTPEEEQFIIDWYDRMDQADVPSLDSEDRDRLQESIWAAIKPEQTISRKRWPLVLRAAAISLPILACIALYFSRPSLDSLLAPVKEVITDATASEKLYRNDGIKPLRVALDDGTHVLLQPASELSVSKDFGKNTREVELKGEGFFEVSRDVTRPFLVYTNEVVTRVLGTSFSVRAYDDDKEIIVAVRTGKVSVYANKKKTSHQGMQSTEVILTPNQKVVYHRVREVISKKLVDEPEIVLPNSDLFRMQFENADVSEIFDVLAENYGVAISYDKEILRNCKLTTSMSDEGLYERIEVICKAIGASYSIDDDAVITIKSKGC